MEKLQIGVASGHVMVLSGLTCWVHAQDQLVLAFQANHPSKITVLNDGVLILDYTSNHFSATDVRHLKNVYPEIKILGILPYPVKEWILDGIQLGIKNFILTECDTDEVLDAIYATKNGLDFMCGKVAAAIGLVSEEQNRCEGTLLTQRELDIVRLIAEGQSNKLIADQLCLSPHTVNTHRKNIMSKLGVNNTAGLVMYAVRENLLNPNKFLFS